MDVVKETLNVAGLLTTVYAPSHLRNKRSSESVVVLFFLGNRKAPIDLIDPTAQAAFAWVAEKQASSKQNPRDFIVVTFEHRNHGKRLVDERANLGWSLKPEEHNERQATDLYGMIMGAVNDISFLIDFLPAYLFPNDERTIGEWVLAGFSLGAHVTWLGLRHGTPTALAHHVPKNAAHTARPPIFLLISRNPAFLEPRIRIGIPISGCPDYLALIEQHAERLGIPCVPPYIPASLRALVRAHGTVAAPAGTFVGKRVLVLAGADDKLVPWAASRAFVEALDVGRGGRKEVVLLPGVKHELTDGMREEMFRFFWEEALVGEATVRRSAL